MNTQVIVALACGVSFVVALIVLAIKFPNPSSFQYTVFRIVLSLAAAGFAAMIPGFIDLKINPGSMLYVQAGGALAVFAVVFFFNPAEAVQARPAPEGARTPSPPGASASRPAATTISKPARKDDDSPLGSGLTFESVRRLQDATRQAMDRAFQPLELRRTVTIRRPDATLVIHETLVNVSGKPSYELTRVIDSDAPVDFKDLALTVYVTIDGERLAANVAATPSKDGRTFVVKVDFKGRRVPPGGSMVFEGSCHCPGSVARNRDYWVFPALHERPVETHTAEILFPTEPVEYAFFKVTSTGEFERMPLPPPSVRVGDDGVMRHLVQDISTNTRDTYVMTWRLDKD